MAYNSRLNYKTGHHALPVLLSSRLTLWRTSFRPWPIKRTAYGASASASASTPEADFDDNSCGITVGAVIPTARALKSFAPQCLLTDLLARGLYRRSGFSPCPEDMQLQIYKLFLTNSLVFPRFYNIFATLTRRSIAFSITTRPSLPDATSPDGGIGRRAGLKHQWSNPCRFDPGSGYQTKCKC